MKVEKTKLPGVLRITPDGIGFEHRPVFEVGIHAGSLP